MTALPSHVYFEHLLGRGDSDSNPDEPLPSFVVVYFTASWCKKCKTFDLQKIMAALPQATWYKNDIDENEHTYAYSSLRSIPSFVVIKDKKFRGKFDRETDVKGGVTEETSIAWLKQFI